MADTSGDFAQGGGWGNENNEMSLTTVIQLVRSNDVVRQSHSRQILRVLSRTLHPADARGGVAPERNGPPVLPPQCRQRCAPASSTYYDGLFHFRSKRGSRPWSKRMMLLRCRKIIKAAINRLNPKTIGSLAFPKSQALRGNATAAIMEANETKRKTKKVPVHTITAMNVATGNKPRQAPAAAATPFPPRNPSQTGNEWPTTTNKAARIPMRSLVDGSNCASQSASLTAT